MKLALFGAAAVAAAAFVTPALAQTITSTQRDCAQFFANASCKTYRSNDWQNGMAMQTVDNNAYRYHGGPKYND
jgi:O-antigen ligase